MNQNTDNYVLRKLEAPVEVFPVDAATDVVRFPIGLRFEGWVAVTKTTGCVYKSPPLNLD